MSDRDFEKRAAEFLLNAICDLRISKALGEEPFGIPPDANLARLERAAGDKSPRRTEACGHCPGCLAISGRPRPTIH